MSFRPSMKRMNRTYGLPLIVMGLLAGCSSQITLTVLSEPPGAAVLQGDELAGYTPMHLYYPKSVVRESDDGCWQSPPFTIEWVSGAKKTQSATICKNVGFDQQLSIVRPDTPGIEEDIEAGIAMERRRKEQHKREMEDHEDALDRIPGRVD